MALSKAIVGDPNTLEADKLTLLFYLAPMFVFPTKVL